MEELDRENLIKQEEAEAVTKTFAKVAIDLKSVIVNN
jgi:hypothetical protein